MPTRTCPDGAQCYEATSGRVTSYNAVTGYFTDGGSFVSPNSMGGGCYFGGCPAWQFSNFPFSYVLANGVTASFSNFIGTADFSNQRDVKVNGTASGLDSNGNFVNVTIFWEWEAACRSGRGGGCTKHFIYGSLTIQRAQ
jgi:hypothetical protein